MRGTRDPNARKIVMKGLRDGLTVRAAAKAGGCSTVSIYRWRKTDPELNELMNRTKKQRVARAGDCPKKTPAPTSVAQQVHEPDDLWLEQLRKARRTALARLVEIVEDEDARGADRVKAGAEILKASSDVKSVAPVEAVQSKPIIKIVTAEDAIARLALDA